MRNPAALLGPGCLALGCAIPCQLLLGKQRCGSHHEPAAKQVEHLKEADVMRVCLGSIELNSNSDASCEFQPQGCLYKDPDGVGWD